MMKLILDTASNLQYIAIVDKNNIKSEFHEIVKRDHSEVIDKNIEKILDEVGINISSISEVFVNIGPGSFTGLRVALTVAKTIAYFRKINLYTYNSGDINESNKTIYLKHNNHEIFKFEKGKTTLIDNNQIDSDHTNIPNVFFEINNKKFLNAKIQPLNIISKSQLINRTNLKTLEPEYYKINMYKKRRQ